jgi:hypothetical protein
MLEFDFCQRVRPPLSAPQLWRNLLVGGKHQEECWNTACSEHGNLFGLPCFPCSRRTPQLESLTVRIQEDQIIQWTFAFDLPASRVFVTFSTGHCLNCLRMCQRFACLQRDIVKGCAGKESSARRTSGSRQHIKQKNRTICSVEFLFFTAYRNTPYSEFKIIYPEFF